MCKTCEQFAEKVCASCDSNYTEHQISIRRSSERVDIVEVINKQSTAITQDNPQLVLLFNLCFNGTYTQFPQNLLYTKIK